MQTPSTQDIKQSIERAEKCLKENNLDGAENEYCLASRWIETRYDDPGAAKLNKLYERLETVKAKIAIMRKNQAIRDSPGREVDYEYLFQNLRAISSNLYSENSKLIEDYSECERLLSGTQAGTRGIAGKIKDYLTRSDLKKTHDELKKALSRKGYFSLEKIIELTHSAEAQNKEQENYLLSTKIPNEIEKLPEPLKTVVDSYFREAKTGSAQSSRE